MAVEAFSINREFDYVRLDGLRRATGRPAHEWDIYIIKELIDNALDADELLWQQDGTQLPDIRVRVEYNYIPVRKSREFLVQVSNQALFPVTQIADIFATEKYTSSKTFIKGLTRGALGNALKTLLGIPYALHNRTTGGWRPELMPMSIVSQGKKYQPRYLVDRMAEVIRFEYTETETRMQPGTVVSISVDTFDQERQRTLAEIEQLAAHYRLVNPHVHFQWTVEMEGEEWTEVYEPDSTWRSKYQGPTPIQWYFVAAFQDLLGALYRKRFAENEKQLLPVTAVAKYFTESAVQGDAVIARLKQDKLSKADIEGMVATRLYTLLVQLSPRFEAANLGQIGPKYLSSILEQALPLEGETLYARVADDSDLSIPFVIEAAAASLTEGTGRKVWTAVNFTPTYGDPFRGAWLYAPIQPDNPVLGLRSLLDTYELTEETPVVLCLHLICPNVEHSEFSKTDINHLPFKQALGEVLHNLFTRLQQRREEAELQLQEAIFQALDSVLETLGKHERFIFGQLLEKLKVVLRQDTELAAWLERPDADSRLHTYITSYQTQNTVLTQRVARPAAGTLTIPSHPDRYFSVLVEHISHDLLAQNHVNKILYIQGRELEPVVIENNWLCQMDMALLHNLPDLGGLRTPLIQLASRCDLPVLVLHDATEVGQTLVTRMREWLERITFDPDRLVDVGLIPVEQTNQSPIKVVEMMPNELVSMLTSRLSALDIPIKWLPDVAQIRRDISQRVEQSLQSNIWEGMGQQLQFRRLLNRIDHELGLTAAIIREGLDEKLQHRLQQIACVDSYNTVMDEIVKEFHTAFMQQHAAKVQTVVKMHMTRMKDEWA